MKNLTINYKKEYGDDGTVYSQTIKTNKKIIELFNNYIRELKEKTCKKFILNEGDVKILYCLEELTRNKNYVNLTTLDFFMTFYIQKIYIPPERDEDYVRILWRNTIIEAV